MEVYRFVSQENVAGKTVVMRAGIDTNVVSGKIVPGARLCEQAKSIKLLAEKKAKIVVIAHQGREGKVDFISLEQHRDFLEKETGLKIGFAKWSENYSEKIAALREGEVLLMENVRFNKDETEEKSAVEHSQSAWVKAIALGADLFVQNAFSVCHRSHASVVGFTPLLSSFVGPLLEKELSALDKIGGFEKNRLLVLGGAKPKDSLKMLSAMLENGKMDSAIVGGLFGNILTEASGKRLGKSTEFLKQKRFYELVEPAKKILSDFEGKILLPVDFAADDNGNRKNVSIEELPSELEIFDIGDRTIGLFKEKIAKAELIVFNGPMGVYEKEAFQNGTREVLGAIAESDAFSLLGGGDTETALGITGIDKEKFSHISLAGKALLYKFLGKELPGLIGVEE